MEESVTKLAYEALEITINNINLHICLKQRKQSNTKRYVLIKMTYSGNDFVMNIEARQISNYLSKQTRWTNNDINFM